MLVVNIYGAVSPIGTKWERQHHKYWWLPSATPPPSSLTCFQSHLKHHASIVQASALPAVGGVGLQTGGVTRTALDILSVLSTSLIFSLSRTEPPLKSDSLCPGWCGLVG